MMHQLLRDQILYSSEMVNRTLEKLTPENIYFRLTENTAGAGFLLHHLAETHHSFNRMIFGEPIDFSPITFRVESDKGLEFEVDNIKMLMNTGVGKIADNTFKSSDEMLLEEIKTFMGERTRSYMLFYLIHHNSYHIGQAELALKKGRSF